MVMQGERSMFEKTIGHTVLCDVVDSRGTVLAWEGQLVTGEVLERIAQAGAQQSLIHAVFEVRR